MNTPAHLIVGAAVFGRRDSYAINFGALLGAAAPDLSLYVLAGVSIFILGISPDIVFGQYYFSPAWQQVFAIDNSFVVWGAALAFAAAWRSPALIACTGAALLHLALDFPLHNDDARPHFWPISDWVFESPVSYWDRDHYADIVAPIEGILSLGLCAVLWRRFRGVPARLLILVAATVQIAPVLFWRFVFSQ